MRRFAKACGNVSLGLILTVPPLVAVFADETAAPAQQDFAKAASLEARVMKIRVTRTLKRAAETQPTKRHD
jgi:hypothetical protein